MKKFSQLTTMIGCAAVLALSAPIAGIPALANGGGGGGGAVGGSAAPSYDPVEEYEKGVQALEKGEYKKASSAFNRVLKVARKDANTNYYMGVAQTGLEKHKKAARYFKSAIRHNPDLYQAYPALTKAYVANGKTEKAQEVLGMVDERLSECADGCASNAALLETKAAVEAALSGEAVQQESYIAPQVKLASAPGSDYFGAVALVNQEKYVEAIAELSELARQIGPHPDLMNYLGYSHRKLGQFDRAEYFYSVALSVDENHRGANEYLGELYVETKQFEKAHTQLKKLEEICSFGCIEEDELRSWIQNAAW